MKSILAALFFVALTGGIGWLLGPTLWQDFKIRDAQKLTAQDVRVEEASCSTKLFVISFCTIKLKPAEAAQTTEFTYLITGTLGEARLAPMRTIGAREILTTNIGMDYLTNRIISFVVFMGIMLALVFGGVIAAMKGE